LEYTVGVEFDASCVRRRREGEKRREFKVKAMKVLRSSMFIYDPTCALILCSTEFTVRLGQYCYRRGG